MTQDDRYTLATGELGAYRLEILNRIHMLHTEFLLGRVGLRQGMQVADIGCGTGNVSNWFARQVGSSGLVFGVDSSSAQLQQARRNAEALGLNNIKLFEASAYKTGLPNNSFDLVYCRFLLMHLNRPADAVNEMRSLLKPNGVLVCEEADFSCVFCDPPSPAYDHCFKLFLSISDIRHQNFRMGVRLYRIFQEVGLTVSEVNMYQPTVISGDNKRLVDLLLSEAADALLEAGLTTREEIDKMLTEIRMLAADENTVFGIPRVTQIWARKSQL
ncbi:methyltransferase domain-containing protein [Chlorogloeopsis sp. ULAP01]|uniref:class I SAM-dependent methyltransferase n=1 Tax=Chlorogloeopsis sp. ULAP01 TaxID=3056483 RepID=UPI0025AB58F7|nr:methyltransferase domain-containing protein [Chlorogloeopsis sp. ULAP01]MDM9382386.1 methyltransferase domain-containing protein [Chlorogloeopsis sp. ULAP01]